MPAGADHEDETVLIAQRIKWWRLERRLSQQVVADRAAMSRSYLTKIEAGTARLDSRSTIEKIARALGVSYADLTGQPMRPDTPELQEAHAAVNRVRIANAASSLDDGADIDSRPLAVIVDEVDAAALAWQECDYATAGRDLDRIISELHAIAAAGRERAEALRLLVRAFDTAAWTARVLGYYDLALLLATRQREIARIADDPALVGLAAFTHTLMIAANGTGHENAQAAAQRAAERAIDELRPQATTGERLEVLGMLHLAAVRSGVAQGRDGGDLLTEASRIAERTGDGRAFHLYFGPTNVAVWRVHFAVENQEGGRAAEIANTIRLDGIPSRARQTMFYRHLGLGLAQEKGREQDAVRALMRAEHLAPGKLGIDPLARETVGHLLSRARATASGVDLVRLARRVGVL